MHTHTHRTHTGYGCSAAPGKTKRPTGVCVRIYARYKADVYVYVL